LNEVDANLSLFISWLAKGKPGIVMARIKTNEIFDLKMKYRKKLLPLAMLSQAIKAHMNL
jgi:hypothetical protein